MIFRGVLLLVAAAARAVAAPPEPQVSYDEYQVFRLPVMNVEEAHKLQDIVDRLGVDMWRPPSRFDNAADVGVPLGLAAAFKRETADFGKPSILHKNLADSIAQEGPLLSYDGTAKSPFRWLTDIC